MPSFALRSVSEIASGRFRYLSRVTMKNGLEHLNGIAQGICLARRNDFCDAIVYNQFMSKGGHDWFLGDWLRSFCKKQADVVRDLGWNKSKISLMLRGIQPYTRAEVNEISAYLEISPHELLMHPSDAYAIRRLHADMLRIATSAKLEKVSSS